MPADGRARRRAAALVTLPLVGLLLVGCGSEPPAVPTPSGIALPDVELTDPDRNGVERGRTARPPP
jgi:hypothetical protein